MCIRDRVRLDYKFVFMSESSNRKISEERLNEYRRLFKELKMDAGVHRDRNGAVRLVASSAGVFISNSEKSYVYSNTELSPLVDSLDRVAQNDHGDQSPVYKKLYGNWYLYYESW